MTSSPSAPPPTPASVDVAIIGAGFGGMYMLHHCRELGFTARVFEAGSGVGGTWYWNRYPGARCDVESLEYSYRFDADLEQEWEWSERYSAQPEILDYARHVADRFDLRRSITFDTRVTAAHFDESARRWTVTTDGGHEVSARWLVAATGCLSSPNTPEIPGRDSFAGETLHTGRWPHHDVELSGRRVGIIGTGSSAIQAIPVLAEAVGDDGTLTIFQRTPQYSLPARNRPRDDDETRRIKADYPAFRARNLQMPGGFGSRTRRGEQSALAVDDDTFRRELERRWEHGGFAFMAAYADARTDLEANARIAEFVRSKIAELVDDPETARRLMPDTVLGCKRLCLDTDYFETFNRPNVKLVHLGETPIDEITPAGVTCAGTNHELDVLIFATGFDAMTGALNRIDIRGREGRPLTEAWSGGPRNYLGLTVPGFPNLFTITGPGSPSVLTNMIVSIEHHVEFIGALLDHLRSEGLHSVEATESAADDWVEHVNAVADTTLYPHCNSWYLGANIPGKTRVFMPLYGFPPYAEHCEQVVAAGYAGFELA